MASNMCAESGEGGMGAELSAARRGDAAAPAARGARSNSLFPDVSNGFELDGKRLRVTGMNRIGNMVVPNDNYCKFEEWIMPILDKMADEQVRPAAAAAAAAAAAGVPRVREGPPRDRLPTVGQGGGGPG